MITDLSSIKSNERKAAAAQRDQFARQHPDAGQKLCEHVMAAADELGLSGSPKTVSVFWSMGSEIDTRPLLTALGAAGHETCLPVVVAKAQPLEFRAWSVGAPLVDGGFGTSIPPASAKVVTPDILFVPLLMFDAAGFRLGYGGGFYDRTLEKLRLNAPADAPPLAVGIAFSAQRVDTVPRGPHDQQLDRVVTETGLMRFANETSC